MPRTTVTFDLERFLHEVDVEVAELGDDLDREALEAAREGVEAAQQNHPYTDRTQNLTNTAHAERTERGTAAMVWPMDYASFVDKGTSRARPFPFTPIAERAAAEALNRRVTAAVLRFLTRMVRRA